MRQGSAGDSSRLQLAADLKSAVLAAIVLESEKVGESIYAIQIPRLLCN